MVVHPILTAAGASLAPKIYVCFHLTLHAADLNPPAFSEASGGDAKAWGRVRGKWGTSMPPALAPLPS